MIHQPISTYELVKPVYVEMEITFTDNEVITYSFSGN